MEQGKSSLNPDAASYLPTCKQEAIDKNKFSELKVGSLGSDDETARSFYPAEGRQRGYSQADASDSDVHDIEGHLIGCDVTRKGRENLSDHTGAEYLNEGPQVDLDYLAFLFPDVSENFLANVYSANGGDVEESVDMLKQLESPFISVSKGQPESSSTVDEFSPLKPEICHSREDGASSCDP